MEGYRRAFRLLAGPTAEWTAIRDERLGGRSVNAIKGAVTHALLVPMPAAVAWALGRQSMDGASGTATFVSNLLATWGLYGAAMLTLAAAITLLLPMYGCPRDVTGAFVVATWASTPALFAGAFVLAPVMMALVVVSLPYCCFMVYSGVTIVLGVRRSDAAEFAAAAGVLGTTMAVLLGHGLSALKVI